MTTPIYGFDQVSDTDPYSFRSIINGIVQSIEDGMPHRYVGSVAELDTLTGPLYPNGMIAVLTAASSGLYSGNIFVRSSSKWQLVTGDIQDLSIFVAALTANITTKPGTSLRDAATNTTRIFTNTTGNSEVIVGSTTWTSIAYAGGYADQSGVSPLFGYRLVPGGVMLRGSLARPSGKAIATGDEFGGTTLPSVARPSGTAHAIVPGTTGAVGHVRFYTTGVIKLLAPINKSSSYYVFDGVFLPQT